MALGDIISNFQQLIGIKEKEPETFAGDKINTNALSRNDGRVLSNSVNNLYNNIDTLGAVDISFEKVDSDTRIEFDTDSPYAQSIMDSIDTSVLGQLDGAYNINITSKPIGDDPEAYYARTFRNQDPTLSVEQINREAKAQVTLDGLLAQGVNEEDATQLVIGAFSEDNTVLDNIGSGIKGGFAGGLTDSAAAITSLASRVTGSETLKGFSQDLYEDAARLSVTDGSLSSNIGLGLGFGGTFAAGGAFGKGAGIAAKTFGASTRTAGTIATKAGQTFIGGSVLPSSLESNILQKRDRGEEVEASDYLNVGLDVLGLSVNRAIRNLPIASPLKKIYNQNPLAANLGETLLFEGATWAINPELTWEQQVGNLISGMAFNVATTTGINTSQIRELYNFLPEAELALRTPGFENPRDAISSLDDRFDFNGFKPSEIWDTVINDGERGFASAVQLDAIRALNQGYMTRESYRAIELDAANDIFRNNIGVNNALRDSVSQVSKLTTIREALQSQPREDVEVIRASSIASQRVSQIGARIDNINPDAIESRKVELQEQKNQSEGEELTSINRELRSINTQLREVNQLREELRSIEVETIKPNTDLEVSVIADNIQPEIFNLVEEGSLSIDNIASAIVNRRLGGADILSEQAIAFERGRGQQFIAANESLYNREAVKNADGDIEAYTFTPRVNSIGDSNPVTITKKAYEAAKKQNTRAQKLEYTKVFSQIKASLRGTQSEIRKLARETVKQNNKSIKNEKKLNNLTRKMIVKEQEKATKKLNANIVSAWINDISVRFGRDNGGVNRVKQLLSSNKFDNIKDEDGLQKWFNNAVNKLDKENNKNIKASEEAIIKQNKEYHKNRKVQIKQMLKALDKGDKEVIEKLGRISDEERQHITAIYSNYIDARQDVIKSNMPIVEQYQRLADARYALDNEIANFKNSQKLSKLDREVRNKELSDEIYNGITESKPFNFATKLSTSLSRGLSVISNFGEGGRRLAAEISKVAGERLKRDDRYYDNKALLHKALVQNGFTWHDLLTYGQYQRSLKIRNKPLKDGTVNERESLDNVILEDGTAQNNFFIDRDGHFVFTEDVTERDVIKAKKNGWRPAREQDMDKLIVDINNARAKDDGPSGLNAVIEDLIRLNRQQGEEARLLKYDKDGIVQPLEEDYLFPRLWIHTQAKDIVDNNKTIDLDGYVKEQLDNIHIEEAKQQVGRLVINPDESAYDRNHVDKNFVLTHYDLFGKVIPNLAKRLRFDRSKEGQFLTEYARNVVSLQRASRDLWEKITLQGLQVGVLARLGISPTQPLTQKFIYLSLPGTEPAIFKEALKNKTPFAKNFSTDEISNYITSYNERIRSQSSATSQFDRIGNHSAASKIGRIGEVLKESTMAFTSSADATVAADIATAAIFKNARPLFKKYGIKYSRGNVIDLMRGENDFGKTVDEINSIRDMIGNMSSTDVTNIMIGNTDINVSTFQVKHPLLSAWEFFLGRSALAEATRATDMWSTISKSKNPYKKTIAASFASAGIMTAAIVSKELSLGYAILSNEAAIEINNDDEIDLPDSSLLIKESIAASMILYSMTDNEEDRAAIRERINAGQILRSAAVETVGVLPGADVIIPSPGYGDNIPQSIYKATEFVLDAEDEVSAGSQFLTTAAILAPALYKTETQQWKQEARNQREFNKENAERRIEGKSPLTYKKWESGELQKEREREIKQRQDQSLIDIEEYIVDNPGQYLTSLAELFPTLEYKELNRKAADQFIKNELLSVNPNTGEIIQDNFLNMYIAYSQEGNRKQQTIVNALNKYMIPEDDELTTTNPQVYFETYIDRKSFDEAVTYIMKDYNANLISESKAEDLIRFAQNVWFKD